MVKFNCTQKEFALIDRVVDLALADMDGVSKRTRELTRKELQMDLAACHKNGCPLDFEKLLSGRFRESGSFGHDVWGIRRFIDRTTGKLTNHFLPRCAK